MDGWSVNGLTALPDCKPIGNTKGFTMTNNHPRDFSRGEINIDDGNQIIELTLKTDEDFQKVREMTENLWDNAVNLLANTLNGDFRQINEIPDIDD